MAGEVDQIARGREDLFGARDNLPTDFGQDDLAGSPFEKLNPEFLLEVSDLHGQRRLGDRTGLGGPAEVPVFRQRGQVTQLLQRDHVDKIILSERSGNPIRPDVRRAVLEPFQSA